MFEHVRHMWNEDMMFMTAAQCLWIQRKEGDTNGHHLMPQKKVGRRRDLKPLLSLD
jgi:hypothetical protein